jgi:crotonobetainyl-CoA:carnitine CoA-transferase CaiB-like acyl-CoA transferase
VEASARALAGLKVLEWGRGRASAYAGRLLCGFGAEVLLVEEDEGARKRALDVGPSGNSEARLEGLVNFLHGGKRSALLNPIEEPDRFGRLLAGFDALVLHVDPQALDAGLSPEALHRAFPDLVLVPVTLAGLQEGARQLTHSDLAAHALSGMAYTTPTLVPDPENEPPLRPGGYQADYTSGLTAATCVLLGVQQRRRSGRGSLIDVSIQAALASYVRMSVAYNTYNAPDPMKLNPHGLGRQSPNGRPSTLWGLVPCKDGYFAFQATEQYQWDSLMRAAGDPPWSKEERFQDPYERVQRWDEIEPLLLEWTMARTKDEIFHTSQAEHVPVFPCYTVDEILADKQVQARAFFVEVQAGQHLVKLPGALIHLERSPWRHDAVAPAVGEHTGLYLGTGALK